MTIQENIAATLNAAMEERHQSQAEFSRELGIAQSSLQEYLKENSNPRADTIAFLSEKLEMTPAELISGVKIPGILDKSDLQAVENFPQSLHPLLRSFSEEYLHSFQTLFQLSDTLYKMEASMDCK